jgi:hypothetical protein
VFVDDSGRRARRVRRVGMAIGVVFAGYCMLVIAGLMGASWVPHIGVPSLGGVDRSGANTGKLRGAPLVPVVSTPITNVSATTAVTRGTSHTTAPTLVVTTTSPPTSSTTRPSPPTSTPGKGNGPPSSTPGQSKHP